MAQKTDQKTEKGKPLINDTSKFLKNFMSNKKAKKVANEAKEDPKEEAKETPAQEAKEQYTPVR